MKSNFFEKKDVVSMLSIWGAMFRSCRQHENNTAAAIAFSFFPLNPREQNVSKRRKVDTDCLTCRYTLTGANGKPVCLVSLQQDSVLK